MNITATAQVDNSVQQTVTQKITQNAEASISISPSQPMAQAGSQNTISFQANAINIPDFSTDNVNWTVSCNSLAPPNENCGKPFGQYKDKGGPGCFAYPGDGGLKVCDNGSFDMPGGQQATYTPPGVLGSSYMDIPECNTSQGQADGFVGVTAAIGGIPNCPDGGTCQATVCIDISPPGAKRMGPGKERLGPAENVDSSGTGVTPPTK